MIMGRDSKIEWCHHTFNPWIGCSKVSGGCAHCYAETLVDKRWGKVNWGDKGTRVRTSAANWKQPLAWDRAAKEAGERHRVFCASLADVFEDRDELLNWRYDLFELIGETPNLDVALPLSLVGDAIGENPRILYLGT
jgi:protein gp37